MWYMVWAYSTYPLDRRTLIKEWKFGECLHILCLKIKTSVWAQTYKIYYKEPEIGTLLSDKVQEKPTLYFLKLTGEGEENFYQVKLKQERIHPLCWGILLKFQQCGN